MFLWAAFAYVALLGVRYLLGARQYLTCALRVLATFWAVLLPQQWLAYRLRRSVAEVVGDRTDQPSVVRAAIEVMANPRYAKWRSLVRQAHARLIAKQFAVPHATSGDRAFGVVAYVTSWVPLAIAVVLWRT